MNNKKVYSLLGLATRARKACSGEEQCHKSIKKGKKMLVIVANDASENTKNKFINACEHYGVDIKFFGEKEHLGKAIGKEIRAVVAVFDLNFAKRLSELIDSSNYLCGGDVIGEKESI